LRLLADECVWQITIEFLQYEGHQVIRAVDVGLRETNDQVIFDYAVSKNCVLITRDKDFSNILIYPPSSHLGLIVLKIKPETIINVHKVLKVALSDFTQESIQKSLIIVDRKKFRLYRSE